MHFNEMGIDFKVGFATDTSGRQWLLRIPRRTDMGPQINSEKAILELVSKHLSVQVPKWQTATPEDIRSEIANRLQLVKSELGMGEELEKRYKKWLDKDPLWPDFSKFVHGDLYAGHVLTQPNSTVSGIIDWTTAHMSDIALDFAGHLNIFGENSLQVLIDEYQKLGGITWDHLFEQSVERAAAAPLTYGFFAIETQDERHIQGAREQLGG